MTLIDVVTIDKYNEEIIMLAQVIKSDCGDGIITIKYMNLIKKTWGDNLMYDYENQTYDIEKSCITGTCPGFFHGFS